MQNSLTSKKRIVLVFCYAAMLLVWAGCAASSTTVIEEEIVTNSKPMYSYTSLLIRDFELKPDMFGDGSDKAMNQRELRYANLPGELSENIIHYVGFHNIFKTISRDRKPDATTLVLTGKFIRLGRFKITVAVTLRDGATGKEVAAFRPTLWDVMDTTDSFSELGREVANFIYRIQYK